MWYKHLGLLPGAAQHHHFPAASLGMCKPR